nr:MAG TPA: hypothetical protein [Caudoviricetes sp.]
MFIFFTSLTFYIHYSTYTIYCQHFYQNILVFLQNKKARHKAGTVQEIYRNDAKYFMTIVSLIY